MTIKAAIARLLTMLAFMGLSNGTYSQTLEWAKSLGDSVSDYWSSIAVDGHGNVYSAGQFEGTADFDPGTGVANLTATGQGRNTFVVKLDASGDFVWAKSFAGSTSFVYRSLKVDGANNVYIAGGFSDTVDFDPGIGTYELHAGIGSINNAFVCKLDSLGELVWAFSLPNVESNLVSCIELDAAGNLYCVANYRGSVDFDPGIDSTILTAPAPFGFSVALAKYDPSGNLAWAIPLEVTPNSIALDAAGNIHACGFMYGTVDIDPGPAVVTLGSTSLTEKDIFLCKLDSGHNFVWGNTFGQAVGDDVANGIAVDDFGNVYTTGAFVGAVDFDPGAGVFTLTSAASSTDSYVSKWDVNGNFVWARKVGDSDYESGGGIAIDALGNVIATGEFGGTCDFDPGTGTFGLSSNPIVGFSYTWVLDPLGSFQWAAPIGGALCRDGLDNVYLTNDFDGTFDANPWAGTDLLSGTYSGYVIKWNMPPAVGIASNGAQPNLTVYPNPNGGHFTISMGDAAAEATLEIWNTMGACVYTGKMESERQRIDLTRHATGIYHYKLQSESGLLGSGKIVVR